MIKIENGYAPPVGGIPGTDLSTDVQASLGKANIAARVIGVRGAQALHTGDTLLAQLCPPVTISAGMMSANSALRIEAMFTSTASTNARSYYIKIGGVTVYNLTASTATRTMEFPLVILQNRGQLNLQVDPAFASRSYTLNQSIAPKQYTIDFSVSQDVTFWGQLALASEYVAVENFSVSIWG